MTAVKINKILRKGKAMLLAYDQGIEHGPGDFNDRNVDPLFIVDIAKKGKFTGLIVGKGIAEKYNREIKKSKVPLIVKLNGKTNLYKGEPVSRQLCSVKEAVKRGAVAIGYTINIGSKYESVMLEDFEKIEEEAHSKGLPVIAWVYPRGKSIEGKSSRELMAYAARTGLEIGADVVKMNWNGNIKDLIWAIKSAGRTKVVIAGGVKGNDREVLHNFDTIMKSGAVGLAIGRNVWQNKNPEEFSDRVRNILFMEKKP